MIYRVIDKDNYIIKIYNDYFDIDIYDHSEVKLFIENLFNKIFNKYKLKGTVVFNIYIDNMYGMIIEVNKKNDLIGDIVDIKIKFNINISFLYEVDYLYLIDNDITNQNIYYYKDKFYLEIVNNIDKDKYIKLLDNCFVIYDNNINNIINKGIKLANI